MKHIELINQIELKANFSSDVLEGYIIFKYTFSMRTPREDHTKYIYSYKYKQGCLCTEVSIVPFPHAG
jgi:hypothetical protein